MKAELRRQERELAEMEQQRHAEAAAAQAAAQAEATSPAEPQGEPPSRQKGPPTGKGVSPALPASVLLCSGTGGILVTQHSAASSQDVSCAGHDSAFRDPWG